MDHLQIALPGHAGLIIALVVLLIYAAVRLIPLLTSRTKSSTSLPPGAPRTYGIAGGAVCPKCHRAFRLGLLDVKLGLGVKFARCEFCGKWSVVRRLSPDELRAAEAAERTDAQSKTPLPEKSALEVLNEKIDQSRFSDPR